MLVMTKAVARLSAGPHQLRCLAAHIRCRALSHEDAQKISGLTSDEIMLAVDGLAQLQKEASTSEQCKHPECSGSDFLAGKPNPKAWLHVDWKWLQPAEKAKTSPPTQEQLQELELCREAGARLRQLRARTFLELVEPQDGPAPDIVLPDQRCGAALVKLAAKPGHDNADQSMYFRQAAAVIFKNEQKFKAKPQLAEQALLPAGARVVWQKPLL